MIEIEQRHLRIWERFMIYLYKNWGNFTKLGNVRKRISNWFDRRFFERKLKILKKSAIFRTRKWEGLLNNLLYAFIIIFTPYSLIRGCSHTNVQFIERSFLWWLNLLSFTRNERDQSTIWNDTFHVVVPFRNKLLCYFSFNHTCIYNRELQ